MLPCLERVQCHWLWTQTKRGQHTLERGLPQMPSLSTTGKHHAANSIAPTEFPRAPATTKTFRLLEPLGLAA
jgi:hypothetical protein